MIDRDAIVAAARGLVGEPCTFRGHPKGNPLDCAGLVARVCDSAGLLHPEDLSRYGRDQKTHIERIRECCDVIDRSDVQPGDLLLFSYGPFSSHLGIATRSRGIDSFIHACDVTGRVVEVRLGGPWLYRWRNTFRFREAF